MTTKLSGYLFDVSQRCVHSITLSPKNTGRISLGLEIRGSESTGSRGQTYHNQDRSKTELVGERGVEHPQLKRGGVKLGRSHSQT